MSRWTDEELRELTTLWPTHSVLQIAKRLHRARAAIRSKARRLRLDGPPPHYPSEDVDAGDLAKRRPLKAANGHGRRRANQTHPSAYDAMNHANRRTGTEADPSGKFRRGKSAL